MIVATRSRGKRLAVLTFLVGLFFVGSVPVAVAQVDDDGGLWYYSHFGFDKLHEQATGAGIKIAVIDGPINPDALDLKGTNLVLRDGFCENEDGTPTPPVDKTHDAEHATNIASMLIGTGTGGYGWPGIKGIVPDATVYHYNVFPTGWEAENVADKTNPPCLLVNGHDRQRVAIANAIDQAIADGVHIINFSINGSYSYEESRAIVRAHQAGILMVAGVHNDRRSAIGWPANGNGVVAVELLGPDMNLDEIKGSNGLTERGTANSPHLTTVAPGIRILAAESNGGKWNSYRYAGGTSYATPWTVGAIALAWSKYPDATANQMLQSLVRNTNPPTDGSRAGRDGDRVYHHLNWGYGIVSPHNMLAEDPTTYPDENPLLLPFEDIMAEPPTAEILGYGFNPLDPPPDPTETPTPTATATPTPTTPTTDTNVADAESSFPTIPAAIAAATLLAVIITISIVITRRNRKSIKLQPITDESWGKS